MASNSDPFYEQVYGQDLNTLDTQDPTGVEGLYDTTKDVLGGSINGAEEALRSAFGLANYVNPWSGGGFMEGKDSVDFDFFDEPDTIMGSLVGGMTQYAVGAALVTGAVTATLAGFSALMAMGAAAPILAGSMTTLGALGQGAGLGVKALSWYRKANFSKAGTWAGRKAFEYTVQAPMIDFAAFSSDQGRFADILKEHTDIENAMLDWVSGDDSDGVLEARFKNVVDGAFSGIVADSVLSAVKGMGVASVKGRKAGIAEATDKIISDEVLKTHKEYGTNLAKTLDYDAMEPDALGKVADVLDIALGHEGLDHLKPEVVDLVQKVAQGDIDMDTFVEGMRMRGEGFKAAEEVLQPGFRVDAERISDEMYINASKINYRSPGELQELFQGTDIKWEDFGILNVPNFTADKAGIVLPYTYYASLDQGALMDLKNARARARGEVLPHTAEEIAGAAKKSGRSSKMTENDLFNAKSDLYDSLQNLAFSTEVAAARDHLSRLGDDPASIVRLADFAGKALDWSNSLQDSILSTTDSLKSLGNEKAIMKSRRKIQWALRTDHQLLESARNISHNMGVGLKSFDRRVRASKVGQMTEEFVNRKGAAASTKEKNFFEIYSEAIELADSADEAVKRQALDKLSIMEKHIDESYNIGQSPAQRIEILSRWAEGSSVNDALETLVSVRTQNIISGTKTLSIGAISPFIVEPYKALRNVLGEVWMQSNPGANVDVKRLVASAQKELYTSSRGMLYSIQNATGYINAIAGGPQAVKDYHSFMRKFARELNTGSTLEADNHVIAAAKLQAKASTANPVHASRFLAKTLQVQGYMAFPAKVIPAVDYVVQTGLARAQIEGDALFEAALKGADPQNAIQNARQVGESVLRNASTSTRREKANAIFEATAKDERVVSGEIGHHQAIIDHIKGEKANAPEIQAALDSGRARGQYALFNRNVQEIAQDPEELLDQVSTTAGKSRASISLEKGEKLTAADNAAINNRMSIAGSTEVLGNEVIRYGTQIAADMAQIVRKHPSARLFAPFLQVPINAAAVSLDALVGGGLENLAKGVERSGGGLSKLPGVDSMLRSMRSADPAVRMNAAVNGYISASVVGSVGMYLTQPGIVVPTEENPLPLITGGGPTDAGTLQALRNAGWRPYSIRVGDKYVSYQRLEPMASWLGILTDAIQVSHYYNAVNPHEGADDAVNVATVLGITLFQRNMTDKTFTKGLNDMFAIMNGDEKRLLKFTRELGTSLLVPNFVRDIDKSVEGFGTDIAESRSMLDKVLNSIPGLESELQDKRRNILGEPVKNAGIANNRVLDLLPANVSQVDDSRIAKEIAAVPNNWKAAPRKFKGVDLMNEGLRVGRQSMYDLWQEETSKITVRGRTPRQELRMLVESDDYKAIPPGLDGEGNYSARAGLIETTIRKFQTSAFNRLMRENSDLRMSVEAAKNSSRARRQARKPRPSLYR